MSDSGGYRGGDDMNHDDITQGDPRLEAIFDALGTPDAVDDATAAQHVAMAAAEAAASPVVAPAVEPATPWYRRVLVRGASLGLTAKMLLGTAVAVAATGGAAAGGILPDPVQSFVADTASHVGLDLPNPRLETTTTTAAPTTTLAGDTTTTTLEAGDDEISVTTDTTPGSYAWQTTTCAAEPVTINYTVNADGTLDLDSVVGDPDDIDTDDDAISVEFGDVTIDIEIDGDDVTIDEDRDCDDEGTTTTTTTPEEGSTTTTTDPDDDDDDDSDDDSEDDESDDDDGTTTTTTEGDHPQAGPHTWNSTSCASDQISVAYTVTAGGELVLGPITGDVADIDEDDDRIQVEFTDGVEVDIRIDGDSLSEDEDRDCGEGD